MSSLPPLRPELVLLGETLTFLGTAEQLPPQVRAGAAWRGPTLYLVITLDEDTPGALLLHYSLSRHHGPTHLTPAEVESAARMFFGEAAVTILTGPEGVAHFFLSDSLLEYELAGGADDEPGG